MIALALLTALAVLPTTSGQNVQFGTVAIGGVANFTIIAPPTIINCTRNNVNINFDNVKYALVTNPSGGSTNLTIYNVAMSDHGRYSCIYNNEFTTNAIFSLIVVEPIVMSVDQVTFNLNDNVTVRCMAAYHMEANIIPTEGQDLNLSLVLNGVELMRDTKIYSIILSTRSKNLTYYGNSNTDMRTNNITCMLQNSMFWEVASQRVYITTPPTSARIANKSKDTFYPGDTIYCYVDSYPLLTVNWKIILTPSTCNTPPVSSSPQMGISALTMTASCLGQQTWSCSATWTVGVLIVNDNFTFTVNGGNNNNETVALEIEATRRKKDRDIALGVGLGLGIPLLMLLIALIVFFCCGRDTSKKTPPPTKSEPQKMTKQASPVKINTNPNPNALPTYNQVAKSGNGNVRGSPGVPDIGVAHLNGSGSIPQLNSSLDAGQITFRTDQPVNLGKADLGYQNRSFTNI